MRTPSAPWGSSCWRSSHSTRTTSPRRPSPPTEAGDADRHDSVEKIRDLRYETLPQTVSPAQAKRDGLEDLDRNYPRPPPRRRGGAEAARAAEAGRRPPQGLGHDLRAGRGRYNHAPRAPRASSGAQTTNRFLSRSASPTSSRARSRTSASSSTWRARAPTTPGSPTSRWSGSATAVMFTYAERYFTSEQSLALSEPRPGRTCAFIEAQLVFPYVRGQAPLRRGRLGRGQRGLRLPPRPPRASRSCTQQVPGGRAARQGSARREPGRRLAPRRRHLQVGDRQLVGDEAATRVGWQPLRAVRGSDDCPARQQAAWLGA